MTLPRKLLPPHYFLAALVVIILLGIVAGSGSGGGRWLGLLGIVAGIALVLTAARQIKRAGTTIHPLQQPVRLVTDGLFRYSRNPIYLGLSLALLGAALAAGTFWALLPVVAFVAVLDRDFIPREEANASRAFGPAYDAYRARTRRWL